MRVSNAHMSCRTTLKPDVSVRVRRSSNGGGSFDYPSIASGDVLPPATITETADALRILIPLTGVDLQHVHVVASARSIVIEFRVKNRIDHAGVAVTEVQQKRIIRELKFDANLKRRCTSMRMRGDDLEITSMKADRNDDFVGSDLVRFDTRASLGCV